MAPYLQEITASFLPTLADKGSSIPADALKARLHKKQAFRVEEKAVGDEQTPPIIPQGIDEHKFLEALEELRTVLGVQNVELNDKSVHHDSGTDDCNTHNVMPVLSDDEFVASAVVYPGSTEEVQEVVLWANKHLIPLFPISMGKKLGYGGAAPRVRGSVTMDLGRRMSRILKIDPEDLTCLVEPGVSFCALHEALKDKGYGHIWVDTPEIGTGSIIGNTLDRGFGYTPYGDHWACHSGMEVVLPTGEVIRTGMGAMSGSNTWQAFPYGFGPHSDGIFSQSNFGIVTKMGVTLMPNPGGHENFIYTFQREEDLAQLVDIIRPLRISSILENGAQLRHITQTTATRGLPRSHYHKDENTPIPTSILHKAASVTPLGDYTWIYHGMCHGPEHIRRHKLALIDAEFRNIPGCKRIDPSTLPQDEYAWAQNRPGAGIPQSEPPKWLTHWLSNNSDVAAPTPTATAPAHITFSPIIPLRGKDAVALYSLAQRRHAECGIDLFPTFVVGLREMHVTVELVFDSADASRRQTALECLRAMVGDAAGLGYGVYRTHLAAMDQVAQTYSWGEGALLKFNEKLKDFLDPNGILAPGRCGIWPVRYRGKGWQMIGN